MTIYIPLAFITGSILTAWYIYVRRSWYDTKRNSFDIETMGKLTAAEIEIARLQGDIDNKRDLFAQIVAQETPSSNATVKRIIGIARAGVAK